MQNTQENPLNNAPAKRLSLPVEASCLMTEGGQALIYKAIYNNKPVACKAFENSADLRSSLLPKPEFEHYCLTQIKSDYVIKPLCFFPKADVRLPCGTKAQEGVACLLTELCRCDLLEVV